LRVALERAIGKLLLRNHPQLAQGLARIRHAIDAEEATKHPLDVAIQDCRTLAEGKCRDRRRRRTTDTRQRLQLLCTSRKLAAVLIHHTSRAGMQISRPAVVAQPAPGGHHISVRR